MKRRFAILILMLISPLVTVAPLARWQMVPIVVAAADCSACLQAGQDAWFSAYFWCREQGMDVATCLAVADAVRCNNYKASGCGGCEGVPTECNAD